MISIQTHSIEAFNEIERCRGPVDAEELHVMKLLSSQTTISNYLGSHCHAYLRLPNADTKHPSFGVVFSPFKCCKITARLITSECRIQRTHHGDTMLNSASTLCFEYDEGCMVLLTRHLATHDEAGRKRHAELKALLILTFLAYTLFCLIGMCYHRPLSKATQMTFLPQQYYSQDSSSKYLRPWSP